MCFYFVISFLSELEFKRWTFSGQTDADKIIGNSKWNEAKDEWQLPKMHFDVQLPKLALPGATSINNNNSNAGGGNMNMAYEEKRRSNKYDSESTYTARAQALSTSFSNIPHSYYSTYCPLFDQ